MSTPIGLRREKNYKIFKINKLCEILYAYILYAVNLQSSSPIYTMSACELYLKKNSDR